MAAVRRGWGGIRVGCGDGLGWGGMQSGAMGDELPAGRAQHPYAASDSDPRNPRPTAWPETHEGEATLSAPANK